MLTRNTIALGLLLTTSPVTQAAAEPFISSSYLGDKGFNDATVGMRYRSDGTILMAGNFGPETRKRMGIQSDKAGVVLQLDADGRKILTGIAVAEQLNDLAIDAQDQAYLAAGNQGAIKLSADLSRVMWTATPGDVTRIDAGEDGTNVCLTGQTLHVLSNEGKSLGSAKGGQFTSDVCIDSRSKTIIQTGFRNARAFDGKKTQPVQISYIRGHDYQGGLKWKNYDWSTDPNSDEFINKPTNNMADSRGDRCAIGHDGKLYVSFQVAGGNHIFRYHPRDITQPVKLTGGDAHHQFHNSKSEHKCFFARYDPASGDFLAGQQFCGRLGDGRANAVVTKSGDITADADGRVCLVGRAAFGLPLTINPTGGDYSGGGFLLVMSADLKQRLLVTRTCDGKGDPHAVDARSFNGRSRVVFGGGDMPGGMFTTAAIQSDPGDPDTGKDGPKDGFFAMIELPTPESGR